MFDRIIICLSQIVAHICNVVRQHRRILIFFLFLFSLAVLLVSDSNDASHSGVVYKLLSYQRLLRDRAIQL